MTAEIVSVGTELLLGQILDTHAMRMSQILAQCGITCRLRLTVGDNLERIVEVLRGSLERADIVITIGGLGPTQDDLTREAIAAALGVGLDHDSAVEEKLREYFRSRKISWTESQVRQAMSPSGATLLDNPHGTASGMICEKDGKAVIALPGPRGEFTPMAEGPVREFLQKRSGGKVIHSRTVRICGMGESAVEAKLGAIMLAEDPTVAPYAHLGEVHLRITSRGSPDDAKTAVARVVEQIRAVLGDHVYGEDDTTLEAALVELLCSRSATVATAESITGGGLAMRLTNVPGSSETVKGGIVAYTKEIKQALLDVSAETLSRNGPVSAETAREMAVGAKSRLGADYAVSLTGNAGPSVDSDNKPVGLVYVAVAGPQGVQVEEHQFRGTREDVRRRAEQAALVQLRKLLL